MSTLTSNIIPKDSIDRLIFEKKLRIANVYFNNDLDLMLVVLNNKSVIKANISDFPALKNATSAELSNWRLIGGGLGIHWPDLDEDISLSGLLREYVFAKTIEKLSAETNF